MKTLSAQVMIVGAGPVGLTLALDLAQRGIDVVVAEQRAKGEPPSVKCNHVSARTMEIFRRLRVANDVRNSGLPPDYPNDVSYRLTFTGEELSRIPIPARAERFSAKEGPDTWWPTPEPPHRINQIYLEPVLFGHVEAARNVRMLVRTAVEDFHQADNEVQVIAVDLDTGEQINVRCEYLVGCDGGRSTVRRKLGLKLQGDEMVGRVQSTYFRAPDLYSRSKHPSAWGTFSFNPRRCGVVYAIDGREKFIMHNYLAPHEMDFEAIDRDWALRQILGVGSDFEYEILKKEDWISRRLVATRFRDRRVFICGDAAHLWVPMAGYGMNAGIADAMNLSWLLAGRLEGWVAEAALDAHEAERLPITEQVSKYAMNHALALQQKRGAVPAEIEEATPIGEAARAASGRILYDLNVKQYCCGGLNFGYYYDRSPLIAYDEEEPPAYSMDTFTPSTVPGCRTPHLWLDDGRSLYDALGPGYTLLRFDPRVSTAPLEDAASLRGVPFNVLDVVSRSAPGLYEHSLVLSRPDQHVAWRGGSCPADSLALIDKVRGGDQAKAHPL